jgi:hypothetical protein
LVSLKRQPIFQYNKIPYFQKNVKFFNKKHLFPAI